MHTLCSPACLRFLLQVNDFSADAIISQLLLLDAQDPTKVSQGVQEGGACKLTVMRMLV
jgi:hypothetical protein